VRLPAPGPEWSDLWNRICWGVPAFGALQTGVCGDPKNSLLCYRPDLYRRSRAVENVGVTVMPPAQCLFATSWYSWPAPLFVGFLQRGKRDEYFLIGSPARERRQISVELKSGWI